MAPWIAAWIGVVLSVWPFLGEGFSHAELTNSMLRRPFPPFILGDAFRAHCDFVLDETHPFLILENIPDRSAIFVQPSFLSLFFEQYHAQIQGSYILVTHNGDDAIPGRFAKYLEEEKLLAWLGQNVEEVVHPKLFPIPIGLGNRYTWNHANVWHLKRERETPQRGPRDILAYLCIDRDTNRVERREVLSLFSQTSFVTYYSWRENVDYLSDLKRAKFVFCPRGGGLDCHRMWEALYLGAIPIVKTSASDKMYEGLPVLIIQKWGEINEAFLLEAHQKISSESHHLYKLNIQYWLDLIDAIKTGVS